jgi:hypothetical protein
VTFKSLDTQPLALLQTVGGDAANRLVEGISQSGRVEFQLFGDKLDHFGHDR